jgi:hypothetical protein
LAFASAAEPELKLASDGFPTGQSTPEGAACDLGRAFINADGELFRQIVIPPYGGEALRRKREEFVDNVLRQMVQQKKLPEQERSGPKSIGMCFAARHLSRKGPASYAFAAFDYRDVMFVDVGTHMRDGSRHLNRTLVLQDKNGKWYAHPVPAISPLLMTGLNEESESEIGFRQRYKIKGKKTDNRAVAGGKE